VQELRKQRKLTHDRNQKHDYLLTGRIKCAVCEGTMFGRRTYSTHQRKNGTISKSYYSEYRCGKSTRYRKDQRECMGGIAQKKIETVVWDYIYSLISKPEDMAAAVVRSNQQQKESLTRLLSRRDIMEDEIQSIKRQRDKLLDTLVSSDEYTADAIRARLQLLSEQQRGLERQLEQVNLDLLKEPEPVNIEAIQKLCQMLLGHNLSMKGKKRVLEALRSSLIISVKTGWRDMAQTA
jgi:site-specific DNA recombinase